MIFICSFAWTLDLCGTYIWFSNPQRLFCVRCIAVIIAPPCESADPVDILVPWNLFISQSPRRVYWLLLLIFVYSCGLWFVLADCWNPSEAPTKMFVGEIPNRSFGSPHSEFLPRVLTWDPSRVPSSNKKVSSFKQYLVLSSIDVVPCRAVSHLIWSWLKIPQSGDLLL